MDLGETVGNFLFSATFPNRFRLQEGLDGSGIRTLRIESSLRRPVIVQDVRFHLQEGVGFSPLQAALLMTPFAVGAATTSPLAGRLVGRIGLHAQHLRLGPLELLRRDRAPVPQVLDVPEQWPLAGEDKYSFGVGSVH